MTYKEQLELIKDIPIREGERKIITCPVCGGSKKMSVSKFDGKLLWNCFRASCNTKGIHSGDRGLEAAKNYLNNKTNIHVRQFRPLPEILSCIESHANALQYVKSVNSYEAYQNKLIKIKYAPADQRVLFFVGEGAVGRLIRKGQPKWISYGDVSEPTPIGTGDNLVLVEDVPSACNVSLVNSYVGLPLLGTTLTSVAKKLLTKYNNVYLILDKDASRKAIVQAMNYDRRIKIRFTDKDLKHATKCYIEECILK
tara:strand:+ start:4376 stop:5137 length:762 start_codon:yes stop_codon:yes gene_type:complete